MLNNWICFGSLILAYLLIGIFIQSLVSTGDANAVLGYAVLLSISVSIIGLVFNYNRLLTFGSDVITVTNAILSTILFMLFILGLLSFIVAPS